MKTRTTATLPSAEELILAILTEAGGSLSPKVRLYKVFYAAHLFYWRRSAGILSRHPIVRMTFGPGIDRGDEILRDMAKSGKIRIEQKPTGPYFENTYRLPAAAPVRLRPEATQAIREALDWVGDRPAVDLSEETHRFSRSWRDSAPGQELDIYQDAISDDEYEERRRLLEAAEKRVNEAFR